MVNFLGVKTTSGTKPVTNYNNGESIYAPTIQCYIKNARHSLDV
jgi:hypothetical protein